MPARSSSTTHRSMGHSPEVANPPSSFLATCPWLSSCFQPATAIAGPAQDHAAGRRVKSAAARGCSTVRNTLDRAQQVALTAAAERLRSTLNSAALASQYIVHFIDGEGLTTTADWL